MVSISEGTNNDRFACLHKLTDMVESEQNLLFLGGCFKCQTLYIHLNRTSFHSLQAPTYWTSDSISAWHKL